jgi:glutamate carboxypeptidase
MADAETEKKITDWLGDQQEAMIDLLRTLVDTDSNTYDKSGVDRVGAHIRNFLEREGIPVIAIPHNKFGDALRATVASERIGSNDRPILVMGHRDTVFPIGEAGQRPFTIKNGRAYGPGVADMKGGLVLNCFVLAAMKRFGAAAAPVIGLFTADEEIASPSSRALIEEEGAAAQVVFNTEPGRPNGNVVTGRKGGTFLRLDVYGRAAHAGSHYAYGRSAILQLGHVIPALHSLTDLDKGVSINVGVIGGGQTVNTIAPHCFAEIDLRFVTIADRACMMAEVERVVGTVHVTDTRSELRVSGEFLPLVENERSRALFRLYANASADIGVAVEGEFSGGCADSGFASRAGTPALDGLGPVGDGSHTPEEYIEIDSLVPRAQAMALAIARWGTFEPQ